MNQNDNNIKLESNLSKKIDLALSYNLLLYILDFFILNELITLQNLNSKFRKLVQNSKIFEIYIKLVKSTPISFKKVPERILTVLEEKNPLGRILSRNSDFINPISPVNLYNLPQFYKDSLISNYLYFLIRQKEELLFYDDIQINQTGYIYVSKFLAFPLCKIKSLTVFINLINSKMSNSIKNFSFQETNNNNNGNSINFLNFDSLLPDLLESIKKNQSLINLNFSFGRISNENYFKLGECIRENKNIKRLDLINISMNDENFEYFHKGLIKHINSIYNINKISSLSSLDLSRNNLGLIAMEKINDILLQEKFDIKHLSIQNNNLTDEHIIILSSSLEKNKSLLSLDLSQNFISTKGLRYLSEHALRENKNNLNFLTLRKIMFDEESVIVIGEIVKYNTTLCSIDISENFISNIYPVAESLKFNKRIKSLDLAYCNLGDQNLKKLYDNISETGLNYLNLRFNNLTDVSVPYLESIIKHVGNVNVSRNFFDEKNVKYLKNKIDTACKDSNVISISNYYNK
jgi:hypothetical protein